MNDRFFMNEIFFRQNICQVGLNGFSALFLGGCVAVDISVLNDQHIKHHMTALTCQYHIRGQDDP